MSEMNLAGAGRLRLFEPQTRAANRCRQGWTWWPTIGARVIGFLERAPSTRLCWVAITNVVGFMLVAESVRQFPSHRRSGLGLEYVLWHPHVDRPAIAVGELVNHLMVS